MTLILTALSSDRVVQVSDRKLTYPDGRRYTDDANKAVVVHCDDAHFSIAYTGLAYVRDKETKTLKKTDHWIADSMCSIMQRPGRWGIQEVYEAFAAHATETFENTRNVPLTRKATAFVLAGFNFWAPSAQNVVCTPVAASLSNMSITTTGNIKVERDFATVRYWAAQRSMWPNGTEIWVDGQVSALASRDALAKAFHRRTRVLHRRLQRAEQRSPRDKAEVAEDLVSVVRMASRHPQYGKYIGRDCTVVARRFGDDAWLADTYKEKSIVHNVPWLVSRDMAMRGSFSITSEDGSDAFTKRDRS